MSNDLDKRLRAALRPIDPGENFTRSVLERIAHERARPAWRAPGGMLRWVSAALAASILLTGVIAHQWQAHRTQRGLEARKQLLEALQVTGNKLDIALRVVNDQESNASAGDRDDRT
jgi:hypothetical protein